MPRRRILLTGFEPFGGETVNPSQWLLRELGGERIAGHRVEPLCLPVEFARAGELLCDAVDGLRPALVLCVGQAGGRSRLSFERVAINLIDARIADNAGQQPIDSPVVAAGPSAYFTSLPVKRMRAACQSAGVPAELSFSAGSYVCNAVFYMLMHHLRCSPALSCRGGFMHVPWLPEQAIHHSNAACLSIDLQAKGTALAMEAALLHADELTVSSGVEH